MKKQMLKKTLRLLAGMFVIVLCIIGTVACGDTKSIKEYKYYGNGAIKICDEFDESNYLIRSTYYYEDGSEEKCVEYENNENGNCIKQTTYIDGEIDHYSTREYNEHGILSTWTIYDADGNILNVSKYIYEYDENGNVVKSTTYDEEDRIIIYKEKDDNGDYIICNVYYSDGAQVHNFYYTTPQNIIKSIVYFEDGRERYSFYNDQGIETKSLYKEADGAVSEFLYDDNGKLIKETEYSSEGQIQRIIEYHENGEYVESEYHNGVVSVIREYDSSKELIRFTDYENDGSYVVFEFSKEIVQKSIKYNSNGDVVEVIEYNADGSVAKITNYN